jgi:hypothetical protein
MTIQIKTYNATYMQIYAATRDDNPNYLEKLNVVE